MVVHWRCRRLDDEDVLSANGLLELDRHFAVGESFYVTRCKRETELRRDGGRELPVRGAREQDERPRIA
jgi:hypothetical protein